MSNNIVLIHGLRGERHGLADLAASLKQCGYSCFVPDLPGCGDRPDIIGKNLDVYADWLHEYIGDQGFAEPPIILGHSMGSIIVSHYVMRYPQDVAHDIILLSPILRSEAGQSFSDIEYGLASGALHLLPSKARYRFMKSKPVSYCISHVLTYDRSLQKHIDDLHYKYSGRFASADALLADMKISMRETTVFPRDKRILVCIGMHDQLTSVNLARKLSKKHDNVVFRAVEGTGHLINYERPQLAAKVIAEFLED